MVVTGVGVRGADKAQHRLNGVVFLAKQTAVMVTAMREFTGIKQLPFVQLPVCVSQAEAVVAGLPCLPQAVRFRHNALRLAQSAGQTSGKTYGKQADHPYVV